MSLAIIYTRANSGVDAPLVTVEAHLSFGLPRFAIVGLVETAVKESRDRVRSALLNAHFEFPDYRVTVNLAPADFPKEGGRFDLPIALGVLAASRQIPADTLSEYEFIGELALSGELRSVPAVLPTVLGAKRSRRTLIIPEANAAEASLVKGARVFSAKHLLEVCAHLRGEGTLTPCHYHAPTLEEKNSADMSEVYGQYHAKRAIEIAAAGKHNLLFIGPPGTGKTMLATRLPGILPDLSEEESLEVAAIASISSQGFNPATWQKIPFRAPHHTTSNVALVGGGRPPHPGEITLAHHGILFLDELPEFSRHALETLREPLESGKITISRAAFQMMFPAHFQLIAAMNPCPCGHAGNPSGNCRCTAEQVQRYRAKLSGPLLDRIDMHVDVPSIPLEILSKKKIDHSETSAVIKEKITQVRQVQLERQQKMNQALSTQELSRYCHLNAEVQQLVDQIIQKYQLSARAYHRILKVSRTIADLNGSSDITTDHLAEALSYRCLDRIKNKFT